MKNFEIIELHNRSNPENPLHLSSEDLTNVPILPLHQDLCVAANLGIRHSERNGHHYVKGLEFLDPAEWQWAQERYPELYAPSNSGCPHLRIEKGKMDVSGILESGYGVDFEPDWKILNEIDLKT